MKLNDRLPSIDVRTVPGEVRMTTSAAGKRTIQGYAAVFNSRSQLINTPDGSGFYETIRPGAFARAVQDCDVRGLFNHDTRFCLGRKGAGTLRVSEDSKGLPYEIDLGTRSYDRDLEESLDRGDVFGSSFSFATIDDAWTMGQDGVCVRELIQVHLFDVGPVVFPAYLAATATVRSLSHFAEESKKPPAVFPTDEQRHLLDWFTHADL